MPWGHFHTAEGPRAAVQLSPQAARWRITSGGVQLGQGIDFLCQEKKSANTIFYVCQGVTGMNDLTKL